MYTYIHTCAYIYIYIYVHIYAHTLLGEGLFIQYGGLLTAGGVYLPTTPPKKQHLFLYKLHLVNISFL